MPGMEDYGLPDDSGWGRFNRQYESDTREAINKATARENSRAASVPKEQDQQNLDDEK